MSATIINLIIQLIAGAVSSNHGLMVSVPDPQPDPKMDQRDTALRRRTRRAKQSW